VLSNLTVFGIFWLIFITKDGDEDNMGVQLTLEDANKFRVRLNKNMLGDSTPQQILFLLRVGWRGISSVYTAKKQTTLSWI
jgi:hypothetical protein